MDIPQVDFKKTLILNEITSYFGQQIASKLFAKAKSQNILKGLLAKGLDEENDHVQRAIESIADHEKAVESWLTTFMFSYDEISDLIDELKAQYKDITEPVK